MPFGVLYFSEARGERHGDNRDKVKAGALRGFIELSLENILRNLVHRRSPYSKGRKKIFRQAEAERNRFNRASAGSDSRSQD